MDEGGWRWTRGAGEDAAAAPIFRPAPGMGHGSRKRPPGQAGTSPLSPPFWVRAQVRIEPKSTSPRLPKRTSGNQAAYTGPISPLMPQVRVTKSTTK